MRKRYIQHPETLELVPADEYEAPVKTHHVMPDIQPYKSMIDGQMITSRSKHRGHLKANGCIEVGNETQYLKPKEIAPPEGLKRRLHEVWNSRIH